MSSVEPPTTAPANARRPLHGQGVVAVSADIVDADRLRARIILRHLASTADLGPEHLAGAVTAAVRTAVHLMVGAYVAVVREYDHHGFLERVLTEVRRRLSLATPSFPELVQLGDQSKIPDAVVAAQADVVTGTLDRLLGEIDVSALAAALPDDPDDLGEVPCDLLDQLAQALSAIRTVPIDNHDVRLAYGPCRDEKAAAKLSSRFLDRLEPPGPPPVPVDPNWVTSPPPIDGEDAAPRREAVGRMVALGNILAYLRDPQNHADGLEEILSDWGVLLGLDYESLAGAFRSVVRDPLPYSSRDRDRQIYLVVVQALAFHGTCLISIRMLSTSLLSSIRAFVEGGERSMLQCAVQEVADGIDGNNLTALLLDPVKEICHPGPLTAELRLAEVEDADLRSWLQAVLAWRTDFIAAGRYGAHPVPRTSPIDPENPTALADWFRQWSRRQGPRTAAWYSATVSLAALGPAARWPAEVTPDL